MFKSLSASKLICVFCLIAAQSMVAINIIGAKILLLHLPILMILCARFSLACLFMLVLHIFSCRQQAKGHSLALLSALSTREWILLISQALCAGLLFNFLLLFGLPHTSANAAGIITSALPAMIVVLSIVFIKERLSLANLLCVSLAALGLLVMSWHKGQAGQANEWLGNILVFLALLPEAGYYVLAKYSQVKLPLFFAASLLTGFNLLFLIPATLLSVDFSHLHNTSLSSELLVLLGLSTGFFYVFWGIGCQQISGSVANLFTAIMPVFTLLLAWLVLHETITILQLLGMSLVIGSIAINSFPNNHYQPAEKAL
jgi:drug/metabolite transporter (DMT)-like permease